MQSVRGQGQRTGEPYARPALPGTKRHAGCHFSQATSRPASKERFLARRSTPRKCESRETCLKDNAACAQNAILAVHLLPSRLIAVVSRVRAAFCHQHYRERRGKAPESEAHGAPKAKRPMG